MKALSLAIQNLWPMLKFSAHKQTDIQTDKQTDRTKTSCPQSINVGGIKIDQWCERNESWPTDYHHSSEKKTGRDGNWKSHP